MNLERRIENLERDTGSASPVRVCWDNGDGTITDVETGEILDLEPGAIMLAWPDELEV